MTKTRDLSDFLIEGGADLPLGKPHIVPDVLYPAVAGNDINGTDIDTSHGSTYTYGELHTDGRKYYYTDIKGSKPIKDPRIGAHFGSQRHKTKSLQLLEQETATQGENIYSVDGREWCRGHLGGTSYKSDFAEVIYLEDTSNYIEIVGYFSDVNIQFHNISGRQVRYTLDGTDDNTDYAGQVSVTTPLAGRYVEAGGVENLGLGATLGIHTLKLRQTTSGHANYMVGFELIAQDTTSTANRSKIQIPSQDVVSYGKKFTVSGTPHYNPFNNQSIGDNTSHGKNTVGWTTYDSTLDTATSLGLDAWVDSGNYYRPVNGGRIVKWVDSSGNIKTSVNMMPPSAKAIGTHSGNSGPHETAWTSTYQPVFSSGSIDHTQAEVAKSFHVREYGNGAANEGSNASGTWQDLSMLLDSDDTAYVMDDGLTSHNADDFNGNPTSSKECILRSGTGDYIIYTFIGTGFSLLIEAPEGTEQTLHIAQNLPYGTHVFKYVCNASNSNHMDLTLDDVTLATAYDPSDTPLFKYTTFHQPKKPPIPEEAVVLADYMLMADFVGHSATGNEKISKGVRLQSCSRDVYYNGGSIDFSQSLSSKQGFRAFGATTYSLPIFGINFGLNGFSSRCELTKDGTNNTSLVTNSNTNGADGKAFFTNSFDLGAYTMGHVPSSGQNGNFSAYEIATPIHTSSHYQSFETPFLHELIGGDRNMEQTNLVVSPDGKTWDEVTRDTSYIGNNSLVAERDSTDSDAGSYIIFDEFRGKSDHATSLAKRFHNKHFAIAYDRFICLEDGNYQITFETFVNASISGNTWGRIDINGEDLTRFYQYDVNYNRVGTTSICTLSKGDYVQVYAACVSHGEANFNITKI